MTSPHASAKFCWVELATSDTAAGTDFYTQLMGWSSHQDQVPGAGTYTMLKKGDGNVGGLYALMPEMAQAGVPPHWMSYVSVASADDTEARCAALGGKVLKSAFDVMDFGRMSVVQDPTGGTFSLWQAKKEHGTPAPKNAPGSACWHELLTGDVDRCRTFYTELFDWQTEEHSAAGPYTIFMQAGEMVAGMMTIKPEMGPVPPHWAVYFAVEDCDASVARATELGAKVCCPPTEIEHVGRFAALLDPQGAGFSVIQLAPPPA